MRRSAEAEGVQRLDVGDARGLEAILLLIGFDSAHGLLAVFTVSLDAECGLHLPHEFPLIAVLEEYEIGQAEFHQHVGPDLAVDLHAVGLLPRAHGRFSRRTELAILRYAQPGLDQRDFLPGITLLECGHWFSSRRAANKSNR